MNIIKSHIFLKNFLIVILFFCFSFSQAFAQQIENMSSGGDPSHYTAVPLRSESYNENFAPANVNSPNLNYNNSNPNVFRADEYRNIDSTKKRNPVSKMGNWFEDKLKKNPETQVQENIGILQIKAGESQLKALEAKKRLEMHLTRCERESLDLLAEYNRLKQDAEYYDNRVQAFKNYNKPIENTNTVQVNQGNIQTVQPTQHLQAKEGTNPFEANKKETKITVDNPYNNRNNEFEDYSFEKDLKGQIIDPNEI